MNWGKSIIFAGNKLIKRNTMKSVAYNEAMDYALDVLKAVKESGYEMDYLLHQFVNVSIRIGANLAREEASMGPDDKAEEYKEAERNAYRGTCQKGKLDSNTSQ